MQQETIGGQLKRVNTIVHPSVVATQIDGEAILLHGDTGVFFGLNTLGTEIWRHLCSGLDYDTIVSILVEEYNAEEYQIRVDVSEFLSTLEARGLISTSS